MNVCEVLTVKNSSDLFLNVTYKKKIIRFSKKNAGFFFIRIPTYQIIEMCYFI